MLDVMGQLYFDGNLAEMTHVPVEAERNINFAA